MIAVARVLLGLVAATCLAVGGGVLITLPPPALLHLAIWLAAAIVLHDGLLAPVLQVTGALAGRLPVPRSAVLLVEGGVLVGLLVTALAVPPLATQHNGPANPSVVPQDYLANLGLFWAVDALMVVTGLVVIARCRPAHLR